VRVGSRRSRDELRFAPQVRSPFLFILALVAALVFAPAGHATALTEMERALLSEMNRVRAERGLAPLALDPRLQRAARAHSADMLRRGYFAHGSFARRVQLVGARGPRLAENLAWAQGARATPRTIVLMWLKSPPHRANLLRPGFRRVGVAAPRGTFAGHANAVVVTANFAGR
jgi:uncharacterized protein YkwD